MTAGKNLSIAAGGNIHNIAANLVSGATGEKGVGHLSISAGGDLILDTVKTGSRLDIKHAGYTVGQTSTGNSGSSISAGGDLSLVARRDIVLTGANVAIGSNGEGSGLMMAGREVNIGAAQNESSGTYVHTTSNANFQAQQQTTTAQGSTITATGALNRPAFRGGYLV